MHIVFRHNAITYLIDDTVKNKHNFFFSSAKTAKEMIYYTKKPKKLWLTLLQYLLCGNVSTTSLIKYSCTTNHIADLVRVTNCLAIHTLHTVHWTQGRQSTSLELKEDMKGRRNFSCVQLLVTLWTIAYHAPLSKGFSRQKYWSGLPFPSPGYLPNPGLLDCRWILYQLSHKGSPRILERVAYLFSSRSSWLRNQTGVSCIGDLQWILYQLSHQGSL